jgi:LemA protein
MIVNLPLILGVVAVLALLYFIGVYNGLIVARNRVKEAWSDIEVHLKRRYDLIPNLVETVKGYAKHESETLEKVISARNSAMGNDNADSMSRSASENALSGALKSIFALSEAYPDLKANANFMELQGELTDTEDKIQASRRFYNSVVLTYNNKTEMFPSSVVAGMFGFTRSSFFGLDEGERVAASRPVAVKF